MRFDPLVLTGYGAERQGSLIGDQRWLAADQIHSSAADAYLFELVFAAATGFAQDGELVFLDVAVDSAAAIGTSTTLEVVEASFNNGDPVAERGEGVLRVVSEVVCADFIARPRQGAVPLEVRFHERATGDVQSYRWDFGDGDTSAVRNPVHVYAAAATFTVSLTVRGPEAADTEVKEGYIVALPDTVAPTIISGPLAVDIKRDRADIVWVTDEAADSFVEYARSEDFADSDTVRQGDHTRPHRVRLEGLSPDTRYYYRVRSTDAAGNPSAFAGGLFHTRRDRDTRPPVVVAGPTAEEITEGSAIIAWRTHEVGTSLVEYATREDLGSPERASDESLVDEHRLALTGLAPDTRYFYRVQSVDSDGNASEFQGGSFRTRAVPDGAPPVLTLGPLAIGVTHTGATVKWIADEPSSSQVEYGTGTDYGRVRTGGGRERVHLVRLRDLSGNGPTWSAGQQARTLATPEPLLLVLAPVVVDRGADRVTVRWRTSRAADGWVECGVGADRSLRLGAADLGGEHEVVVAGLQPGTTYQGEAVSTDAAKMSVRSASFAFTTRAAADRQAPLLTRGPAVSGVTEGMAVIVWATNEPANAVVDYGPHAGYGQSVGREGYATEHRVTLTG
ncbi:MAG: fibronectin type III domain-containing protein, partial [Candidatus Latescibacterota bacterium]